MKKPRMKRQFIPDVGTYDNLNFYVDEEKKIVVCKLEINQYVALKRIRKYSKHICVLRPEYYRIPGVFYGKAKCAPEDTFDIEVGKKIALDRAKAKRRTAINKAIDQYVQDLHDDIHSIEINCFSDNIIKKV